MGLTHLDYIVLPPEKEIMVSLGSLQADTIKLSSDKVEGNFKWTCIYMLAPLPRQPKTKTIKPTCLAVIKDCALRPCELDELLIYIVQQTSLTLIQHVQALSDAESPEIQDYQVIHIQRDRQTYV